MSEKIRESIKKKAELIEKLVREIPNYRSLIISPIVGLPSSQLQKMRKLLKDEKIMVMKNVILKKTVEKLKENFEGIEKLLDYINESFAIILSNKDAFELALMLTKNRVPAKPKPGQIAEKDVTLEPGPTDIPAGPMISEFGKIGVKVGVEKGKIAIKEKATIVKKGEKINEELANVLAKLDISVMSIGLKIKAAYDIKEKKFYPSITIDVDETVEKIKQANSDALCLAFNIAYPCKESIKLLLNKASIEAQALENMLNKK